MKRYLLLLPFLTLGVTLPAQFKTIRKQDISTERPLLQPVAGIRPAIPEAFSPFMGTGMDSGRRMILPEGPFRVSMRNEEGFPVWLEWLLPFREGEDPVSYAEKVLQALAMSMGQHESMRWVYHQATQDADGSWHLRFLQSCKGLMVDNAELIVHARPGQAAIVHGRYASLISLAHVEAPLSEEECLAVALRAVGASETIKAKQPWMPELAAPETVVFKKDGAFVVARKLEIMADDLQRWTVYVDVRDGSIVHRRSETCSFRTHYHGQDCSGDHGAPHRAASPPPPSTANAKDLFGITRLIHTYQVGSTFFMLDGSRPMFKEAASQLPNDPVGAILTLNANNTSPGPSFNASHLTSGNNTWNNPTAVSAHHHTAVTYEYYRQTFNRNSVNGSGGSIISLINVTNPDGTAMDNAFWNGAACFYGNGQSAFVQLAKGLDVVAHELTHGVVQTTANLVYENESGALNESYADIFAAMVDRNDFQIGEDVVKPGAFPSGRMRDMEDPHNGGTSLADPGFQPKHVNEQFKGSADNGGVHINSGIPNHAFFLFATNAQVGKEKAEQVFYRALTTYLVKSSVFLDLRAAVIQSCKDLFGAGTPLVAAAESAFNQVGIGSGSSGGEVPNDYQDELAVNPGERFMLFTSADNEGLYIAKPNGSNIQQISSTDVLSRPSITDDGSAIVFIDGFNQMRVVTLDWITGDVKEQVIQNQPIWQSVCVARDGSRLAAILENGGNAISIFDFGLQEWKDFELYNPTTANGVSTGDVQFPDAIEFDHSGNYVLYDAFNLLPGQGGVDLEYWDIGVLEVWDSGSDDFADGQIFKLFSNLPENASVGNPTFAKNAPFVVAFDYLDGNTDEFFILGANIESGDVGLIFQNAKVSYPNFTVDDKGILFDADASGTGTPLVASIEVEANRIVGKQATAKGLVTGAHWGVAFANGERELTDVEQEAEPLALDIFPNPGKDHLVVKGPEGAFLLEVYDVYGRRVLVRDSWQAGEALSVAELAPGMYQVSTRTGKTVAVRTWVKAAR